MKLEKLTQEQEAKIPEIRDFWLNRILSRKNSIDKNKAKAGIEWLYEHAGQEKPIVIFMDSPFGCQIAANFFKNSENLWSTIQTDVFNHISSAINMNIREDINENIGMVVRNDISGSIWENISDNIIDNIRDNIREDIGKNINSDINENIGMGVRNDVSGGIWGKIGLDLLQNIMDNIRDNIGSNIREETRIKIRENINVGIRNKIYGNIWLGIKDNINSDITENISDKIYDNIRDNIRVNINSNINNNIWENIGNNITDNIRNNIRVNINNNIWENIDNNITDNIRENIGEKLQDSIWDNLKGNVNLWDNIKTICDANIMNNINSDISENIWYSIRESICENILGYIGNTIITQINKSIKDNNILDTIKKTKLKYHSFSYYGNVSDYGWVAYIDYFLSLNLIKTDRAKEFNDFKELLLSGVYDMIQFYEICIVSDMPIKIVRNASGRLHNPAGPAIEFKDGYKQYYINGRIIEPEIFEKALSGDYTKDDFLKEKDSDTKGAIYEIYGQKKMMELLGAKEIDTRQIVHRNGDIETVTLLKTTETFEEIDNQPFVWVKMVCPSTGTQYLQGVEPHHTSAIEAMASLSPFTKDDYSFDMRS